MWRREIKKKRIVKEQATKTITKHTQAVANFLQDVTDLSEMDNEDDAEKSPGEESEFETDHEHQTLGAYEVAVEEGHQIDTED